MEGFCVLGPAQEPGEMPLPAEAGEVSAELNEPLALKQGPRLNCDEAALAAEEPMDSGGDDRSAAALTSRVRPGAHGRSTGG